MKRVVLQAEEHPCIHIQSRHPQHKAIKADGITNLDIMHTRQCVIQDELHTHSKLRRRIEVSKASKEISVVPSQTNTQFLMKNDSIVQLPPEIQKPIYYQFLLLDCKIYFLNDNIHETSYLIVNNKVCTQNYLKLLETTKMYGFVNINSIKIHGTYKYVLTGSVNS